MAQAREDFDEPIHTLIMQSFCQLKDFPGCLVAMHALVHRFGAYPDRHLARILVDALSNLPEAKIPNIKVGQRTRRQLRMSESRAVSISKVFAALGDRRAASAAKKGTTVDANDLQAKSEWNLNLLSELVRFVLVRSGEDPFEIELSVEEAAREMNVPGIETGDVHASDV